LSISELNSELFEAQVITIFSSVETLNAEMKCRHYSRTAVITFVCQNKTEHWTHFAFCAIFNITQHVLNNKQSKHI